MPAAVTIGGPRTDAYRIPAGRLRVFFLEADLCGRGGGVLRANVPVSLQNQDATVRVAKPVGHGFRVDAAFEASRREEVTEIVMREP